MQFTIWHILLPIFFGIALVTVFLHLSKKTSNNKPSVLHFFILLIALSFITYGLFRMYAYKLTEIFTQ